VHAIKRLLFVLPVTVVSVAWGSSVWTAAQDSNSPQARSDRTAEVAAGSRPSSDGDYRELVDRYCATCHNQRGNVPAGDPLFLDTASLDDPGRDAETWEKVIRKLGVGAMPPRGVRSPGDDALRGFRTWLEARLDEAAALQNAAGRHIPHRLNRAEYANSIRDLLALDADVAQLLPSDGGDFGFDNVATGLTASPTLLDRYLTAALQISALAVGDREVVPAVSAYNIGVDVTQNDHVEGLPLGTRGGALIRHVFPADGEYVFSGRLLRTIAEGYAGVEGHEVPHEFVITLDGEQVHSAEIGGVDDHMLNLTATALAQPAFDERMTSSRVLVTAGAHEVGFTWVQQPILEQGIWQPSLRASQGGHDASGPPRLKTLNIDGPYRTTPTSDTASRRRLFVCRPTSEAEEAPCAREIFAALATRAFRRPVHEDDLAAPLAFYSEARQDGGDFDAGIRAGVASVLVSPHFLFRIEQDPSDVPVGAAHTITDLELASRLSFFLWSSIPDDELLDVAVQGRLHEPGVIEAQVRRLLEDDRSSALIANFTGQWLQLRNLESLVAPNLTQFPDFDDNLRQALRRETVMLFESVLRENRSVLELLNADYTFLNERLARHYGIDGVYGTRFRRVQLPQEYRRGLLGHGSILALTSTATRTSPVFRGVYVLRNFLNLPPKPPPPNVPELEEVAGGGTAGTIREQMEQHRSNAMCSTCHRNIDPIGFALENFDPVGRWAENTPDGEKIDASGLLVDGTLVEGPTQLSNALLARPEVFVSAVTEKLLIYALGRGLTVYDMPVIRNIVREAAADDYRLTSLIMGIARSRPFHMRTKLGESRTASSGQAESSRGQ
jgi:cytochrome c5